MATGSATGENVSNITGIVLAGGQSRRLGYRNKALLQIGDETIIEIVVRVVSQVTGSVILITNLPHEFRFLGIPMFRDILPDSGPLGGIYTGLKVSATHHDLVVACDMPFIQPHLLTQLTEHIRGYDVVIPVTADGYHPTCAAYSKDCLDPIEFQIKNGDLKIMNFFPYVRVFRVDFSRLGSDGNLNMFFNVNTRKDYIKALSIAERYTNQKPT